MKRLFFIIVSGVIGFYGLSFAFNEFSYENAKSLANEYISNSSFDENWKDSHPHVEGEGKYFYTDADAPSYVEFKVSCDSTPDCGFVLINFDGDDVSIPIASTSGNTPSEVLAAKNGSDINDNKLYYFNPFEQYAENELTGDIASIDPQDDFGDEVVGTEKLTSEIKKDKKAKKNKSLKDKIVKAKSEAKEFKKSDDFKKKRKELKDKKQTNGKEEVSFKYLDMALADEGSSGTTGYTKPAGTDKYIPGDSTILCKSRTPCYHQYLTYSGSIAYYSGCTPTAVAIIYGYYDRYYNTSMTNFNNLVPGIASDISNLSNPDSNIKTMINSLRSYMGTYYNFHKDKNYYGGATLTGSFVKAINYAKDKGYKNSIAKFISGTPTSLFPLIKTEINAGRPVMVSNTTHSMVVYGYNSTSTLPIVRLNMGWGPDESIIGTDGVYYKYSNIDYNMSSMFYHGVAKTPINNMVTFKLAN